MDMKIGGSDKSWSISALKDVIEKSIKTNDKAQTRHLSDGAGCHEISPILLDVIVEQDGIFLTAWHLAR